ncbi:Sortase family protein [Geodermatophilus obscurus]|uniref:Sortase family protein n=1 Tax=Geodermatophilus obscurus TaxID=1861 RepID=A0A1M7UYI7_9ACTN|nr:class F sortase [Geodermatophilus obscurus]SHN88091.1 Sortase family protein [Geodermatophilus obscurus]
MMRPAAVGAVLGLAIALGAPAAWQLTREPAAAGAPLAQVLPTQPPAAPPGGLPPVTTRDAAPTMPSEQPTPVTLAVPALGIEAPVDSVGVRDDGQMAIPDDVDRVGWYRFGPVPGGEGSAVLAGHVDDREQGLGELAPLREAEVDAEVLVTDAAGDPTRWRVVSREQVDKQALPVDRLFAREGPPRLVLVTCGGEFLPEVGGYESNVVVVAEPVP